MKYSRETVNIEGTTDTDVAYALAHLAGFPKGSTVRRVNNIYGMEGCSNKYVVVFHKKILDRVGGDIMEAIACIGPNIIVGQKAPEKVKGKLRSSDEYLIEFDEEVVDSALIDNIEGEIKTAYSKAST